MDAETARIVEGYVRRLRRSMRGATPDIIDEGEREIRAHIDDALAAQDEAGVGAVLDVLERLGPPEDYGRDLALYMMVEAGYRHWSLRHMVRSTLFWALSTMVGALVVSLFGLAYALALAMVATTVAQHARLLGLESVAAVADPRVVLPRPLSDGAPLALLAAGVALLVLLTIMVRWFVGQYVRRARPHTLGGAEVAVDVATPKEQRERGHGHHHLPPPPGSLAFAPRDRAGGLAGLAAAGAASAGWPAGAAAHHPYHHHHHAPNRPPERSP